MKPRKRSIYPTREEFKQKFAVMLKTRMEQLKLDQYELAKRCEISQAAVSHYICGRRIPSAYTLYKLCIVLAVNPDYFML